MPSRCSAMDAARFELFVGDVEEFAAALGAVPQYDCSVGGLFASATFENVQPSMLTTLKFDGVRLELGTTNRGGCVISDDGWHVLAGVGASGLAEVLVSGQTSHIATCP